MPERYQERLNQLSDWALDFTRSDQDAAYRMLAKETEDALASPLSERVEMADGIRRMLYAAQNPTMSKEFKVAHADRKFANDKFKRLRILTLRKGVLTSLRLAAEYSLRANKVGQTLQKLPQFGGSTWTGLPVKTDIDDSVARWVFDTLAVMAHPNAKGTTHRMKLEAINAFGDAYRHLNALGFADCAKPYDAVIHMYRLDDRLNSKLRRAACQAFRTVEQAPMARVVAMQVENMREAVLRFSQGGGGVYAAARFVN